MKTNIRISSKIKNILFILILFISIFIFTFSSPHKSSAQSTTPSVSSTPATLVPSAVCLGNCPTDAPTGVEYMTPGATTPTTSSPTTSPTSSTSSPSPTPSCIPATQNYTSSSNFNYSSHHPRRGKWHKRGKRGSNKGLIEILFKLILWLIQMLLGNGDSSQLQSLISGTDNPSGLPICPTGSPSQTTTNTSQAPTSGSTTTGTVVSQSPTSATTTGTPTAGTTSPNPTTTSSYGAPTNLPTVNGPCPEFVSGTVTFYPANAPVNKARIWIGSNPGNGALVFYFHGTGMSADDATWSIGENNITDITEKGGVVIAPEGHTDLSYPWHISNGDTNPSDLYLIDEMVACSIQQANIDPSHIHATGLSAGASLTSDMIHRRSNYLASGAPKSGGFDQYNGIQENVNPDNKVSVMLFHGGATDTWGDPAYEFYEQEMTQMGDIVKQEGGFVVMCNHGNGHTEPTDAADAVWQFFQDNPYNVTPKPYTNGLPAGFPSYCQIW